MSNDNLQLEKIVAEDVFSLFDRKKFHQLKSKMSDLVTNAISILREKGLRITEQRKAILEVLSEPNAPISAEENHARLSSIPATL